jgi:type IV pilus assembly protein PilW
MQALKEPKTGGFTLVELMVTLAIGMVVMAAVTTTFISQTRFYSAQEQINEMEQNARGALDVITRELKMAGYKPTGLALTGIGYSFTQLQIQADLNGNGAITPVGTEPNEIITYVFDSTNKQITRQDGTAAAQVLADNITAFTFNYLKADGITPATSSSQIRQVTINITARTAKPDPNYGGYRTYSVTATITPVNLAL